MFATYSRLDDIMEAKFEPGVNGVTVTVKVLYINSIQEVRGSGSPWPSQGRRSA
jgi:hypothetical protein